MIQENYSASDIEKICRESCGVDFLKEVFDRLLLADISVLSFTVKQVISNLSIYLYEYQYNDINVQMQVEKLKYILMIGNVLYNRTDTEVLPIENGVYDVLLEKYKTFDPHFQIGSAVVQFKSAVDISNPDQKKVVTPIFFYEPVERDDLRHHFEEELKRFDEHKLNFKDMMSNPIYFESEYISKRTHNTKHNHPSLVGTLDKCKFVLDQDAIEKDVYDDANVKILERDFFIEHIKRGIYGENDELEMILELKYDGISVEADCNHEVQSARTRGDTGIGEASDITPILKGYQFHRNNIMRNKDETVGVKFEAIMTKSALDNFNIARGYNYSNCRTAIIGLFGASDAGKFRDYITLVPLAVDRDDVPMLTNRMYEAVYLNRYFQTHGEPLRYCYIKGNYKTCLYLIKKFAEEAKAARNYLDFMFDGIVVSYLDEGIRQKLGRENYINKYSMAVKFNPLSKLTTFLGYTYEVGQTGTICPMIHYSPVEFFGTIHTKSTGSSLQRFNNLALKIGDIIEVTYMNDVMPYVTSVDCESNRQNQNPKCEFPTICPECGTPLIASDSGKTAICPNLDCNGRKLSRMTNMLQKLNVKGFAESTIRAIGVYTFHELMQVDYNKVKDIIGEVNASNLAVALNDLKCTYIDEYRIVGALGFTGIAIQKWKTIFRNILFADFTASMYNEPEQLRVKLSNIRGIGPATTDIIMSEYKYFKEDFEYIYHNMCIVDSMNTSGEAKQIRFTGCRNKQLSEQLCNMGYDADGNASVTRQTDILIVPYEGFTSSKLNKISDKTIVVPMIEFIDNMNEYLGKLN